jgi:hypothetical protein
MKKSDVRLEWITEVKLHCACPHCSKGITVIVEPQKLAEDNQVGINVVAGGGGIPGA